MRGALVCVNQNLMVVISKICILSLRSLEFAYERGADRFLGYILCNLITELDAEREREHLSNVDDIKINNYDRVTSHKDMCMRRAPTYQHHFLTQAQLITQCAGPRARNYD